MHSERSPILEPNLVLCLPLHELDGSSVMSKDAYGRLCTVTGGLWTPQGRSFDGVDDFISCPVINMDYVTLMAWVKILGVTINSYEGIIHQYNAADPSQATAKALTIDYNDSSIKFWTSTDIGTKGLPLSSSFALNLRQWYFLTGTYDGSSMKLYINGLLNAQRSQTGVLDKPNQPVRIGRRENWYFNGLIGEAFIYNYALTPLEIQRNYLATKWSYQ